ncbi:2-phospho-L-lactate transferase [Phycicoccus sp. MAQZ13P-2]|uniref:2-phospho-L-lactate transferase n=1 Tax=Phycicoccus mangrovi TaxID=2840470 RepID=UPI001C0083C1|nr:2-phospho-L-lactate transferase [Phycicoccus mangrovi]MBT9255938.1 2-phospho-L-lactate transferase [Phycicoccus mangrovi]MBT9274532.1 2-phospho-L-lactate transferase [Phycicoccus mangrovi]
MRITALAGGVGGARFVRGLRHHLDTTPGLEDTEVTVVANTGDDITLFGLRVSPDVDTLLYTLGGGIDEAQGWGRADESHRVQSELAAYGAQPQWFALGDRDFGTHVVRSQWLGQGLSLSEVTARLATRWGLPEQRITLLPMTDTPVETHVVVDDGAGERAIHFQEWWVRHQASVPARRFVVAGLDRAAAAPGVLDAIRQADVVLLPPSNPVVSIGIVLGVPGVRDALRGTTAPVVGVSPLISGRPVRGHADACLETIGVPATAAAVGGLYEDFLDAWLVDPADADTTLARARVEVFDGPLLMSDVDATARIAAHALRLASSVTA